MVRYLLFLLLCVFALAGAASGQSEAVIWQQTQGGKDTWGPSQVSRDPVYPIHSELADDFELTGSVSAISVGGYNGHIGSPSFPPPFYGLNVRFYAAGPDGKPGALQAEYFREAGDPGLTINFQVPSSFRMTLNPPFAASGRHFVSVQPVMDPVWQARWYWWSANSGAPRGNGAWFRDLLAKDAAWTRQLSYAEMNSDLSMTLYGSRVTPVPQLLRLSSGSVPRSGRLRITGEGFGFNRENSVVRIGGVEALITRWEDTAITAYVPETAPLGACDVVVVTAGGESNPLPVEVVGRASDGRVRWRFQADAQGVYSRPVVAPDGTLYAADVKGHLYALTPDGGLKWIHNAEPGNAAQALALGADGTVYMAAFGVLIAVGPDGRERWRVKEPTGEVIFAGPSVGPDGNIYAVSNDLAAGGGLGLFCVSPEGKLLWNRPGFRGYVGTFWGSQGIEFGSGQLYFTAQNGLVAYGLDGTFRWSRPGFGPCAVGGDGTVYVGATPPAGQVGRISAHAPNGAARGTFSGAQTPPVAGPDGAIYASEGERLVAYDRAGVERWHLDDPGRIFEPGVSPVNTMVLMPGQTEFGAACFLDGVSIAGAPLWRLTLPMEEGAPVLPVSRPRFSPDGETVYVGMTGNQYTPGEASWLYAVDTDLEPGKELPFLSVRPERVGGGFRAGGVVTLPEPAGKGGVTVTLSSSSAAASVPATVTVAQGLRSAGFIVSTRPVTQPTSVTITAASGALTQSAALLVAPPGPESLELERWDADAGETFSGTLTLNGPAPSGGLRVALTSSSSLVKVPDTVTVPAGETATTFPVTVASPPAEREVEITASANGLTVSATVWVWPVWLDDLFVEPDPSLGGETVQGTLRLSGPAPEGGLTVYLESDNPLLLTLPESVTVPAGEVQVRFTGQTAAVTEPLTVDLWAYTELDEIGTWLDILPAEPGDQVEVLAAAQSGSSTRLTVEAVSTTPGPAAAAARRKPAALTVYDTKTGKAIGKLKRQKNGRYKAQFKVRVRPERITVRSSRGGAATRAVSER